MFKVKRMSIFVLPFFFIASCNFLISFGTNQILKIIQEENAKIASSVITSNNLPLRVIRIPMPGYPENYWSYTNSLIVNNSVIVPTYNADEDETALQIYQKAMPGHRIVGVYSSEPMINGGAVHCTTKSIPKIESITRGKSNLLTKTNNLGL